MEQDVASNALYFVPTGLAAAPAFAVASVLAATPALVAVAHW
jgi:hypothetical protein